MFVQFVRACLRVLFLSLCPGFGRHMSRRATSGTLTLISSTLSHAAEPHFFRKVTSLFSDFRRTTTLFQGVLRALRRPVLATPDKASAFGWLSSLLSSAFISFSFSFSLAVFALAFALPVLPLAGLGTVELLGVFSPIGV